MTAPPAADGAGLDPAAAREAALRIEAVSFSYRGVPAPALRDVSLRVAAGEVVVLAGESGSGKSTLARLIAGLLRPDRGRVVAGGLDTSRERAQAIATRVGLVFQNPSHQLLASTIGEELALGPRNLGCSHDETSTRVRDAAARLGLTAVLDRHPYRVPVAVRKRVTIAAILAMRPAILVLDEPTTGQGRRETRSVAALVREEAARGTAVVVITHDLGFAGAVGDRLVVLRAGLVLGDGPVGALLADTAALDAAGLEAPPLVRLWHALGRMDGQPVPMTVDDLDTALGPVAGIEPAR